MRVRTDDTAQDSKHDLSECELSLLMHGKTGKLNKGKDVWYGKQDCTQYTTELFICHLYEQGGSNMTGTICV
jgi:hypothetical protein